MTLVEGGRAEPHFLIVPGLNDSGPTHWQSRWLGLLRHSSKADLGDWSNPDVVRWTSRLDDAISRIEAPVILVAHSLGCHAVAHWASRAALPENRRVSAALLVAPPDCERRPAHCPVSRFAPRPDMPLPFPAIIAASRNDEYASIEYARDLARRWRTDFVDTGELGHINAASDLGIWPAGLALLGRLIAVAGFGRRARLGFPAHETMSAQEPLRAAA